MRNHLLRIGFWVGAGTAIMAAIFACSGGTSTQSAPTKISCSSLANLDRCVCGLGGDGTPICSVESMGRGSKCCAGQGWKTSTTATCICRAQPRCYGAADVCTCGVYEDPSTDAFVLSSRSVCSPPPGGHCCDDGAGFCTCTVTACSSFATEVAQCFPKPAPCTDTETEVSSCGE